MPVSGSVSFGAAVLVCASAATWLARRYALHRNLVDAPGERRSHVVATPRGGGIAIVLVLLPVLGWLAWTDAGTRALALASMLGLALVAGVGWLDDHRSLSPWHRLAVHIVAAALLALGMAQVGHPLWACLGVFALAVGLVNVWNFMDGINGIATTQAIVVGIAALYVASPPLLPLALVAACIGFLPFNFPRARIFLGDVGSGGLGFLVACLFAWSSAASPGLMLLCLLPLAAFLIDAALTLLSRILRGERWWTPHVQHVYQRLVQRGYSHLMVTCGYAAWTLIAVCLIFALDAMSLPVIIGVIATWYLFTAAIWLLIRARLERPATRHQG